MHLFIYLSWTACSLAKEQFFYVCIRQLDELCGIAYLGWFFVFFLSNNHRICASPCILIELLYFLDMPETLDWWNTVVLGRVLGGVHNTYWLTLEQFMPVTNRLAELKAAASF